MSPDNQDEKMTAEEFKQIAGAMAREERWEDLAGLLIERAENPDDPEDGVRSLVRAAQIFESRLADPERAFLTLMVAFQSDPVNEEARNELARVTTAQGRWEELLGELATIAAELSPPPKQAAMYLAMAGWYQEHVGDYNQADRAMEAVLAAEPAHPTALRQVVDGYRKRGDHGRAALALMRASAVASDPTLRLSYGVESAELYRTVLNDADTAAEQYRRLLEIAPYHRVSLQGLAEILWEQKDYSEAMPLFEKLAAAASGDQEQSARFYHRAAWSSQMLGDLERARDNYRRAFATNDAYLPTLLCWSELAMAQKWQQDIKEVVPTLLARPEAGLTGEEQVEHLVELGQAYLALGEVDSAASTLTTVLELDANNTEAREALAKCHGRMSGPKAAQSKIDQQRMLLQGAKTDEERVQILEEIAEIQREDLGDIDAALTTYFEILAIKPDDRESLHEALEIFTNARQWPRAVEILECLAGVSTGEERLRYLVAWGNILNYELKHYDQALGIYKQVLEAKSDDDRTFGRIERILKSTQAWQDLARHYRQGIKRLGNNPPDLARGQLISLWRSLGDLCWRRLQDRESAASAYDVCIQLDPSDVHTREVLAEISEELGQPHFPKAVRAREGLLALTSDADAIAQQIRALARLYGKQQQFDRLFCTSAALVAMSRSIPQEQAFYERTSRPEVTRAQGVVSENIWQSYLCSPKQDRTLSQLFASIAGTIAMSRAKDASELGLDPTQQVNLSTDRSVVGQLLIYCGRLLNVPLPKIYVSNNFVGDLDFKLVREGQQVVPSMVLGQSLIADRGEKELAFFLGRKLARMRAEHWVLWPSVVSDINELRIVVAALVALLRPNYEWPGVDMAALRNYVSFFQRAIPPQVLATLAPTVDALVANPASLDVDRWSAAARQSEDRAGLLCSGDVACALREVLRTHVHGRDAEAMALVRFSVSENYLDLREQLGQGIEMVSTPPPRRTMSVPPRIPGK